MTWTRRSEPPHPDLRAKASDDKRVRRDGGRSRRRAGRFRSTKPSRPCPPAASASTSAEQAKAAKDFWRRGSQAENVEWLAEKGMYATKDKGRKLETNFSGEVDKVNNPKRFSTHQNNPEQVAALKDIATGSPKTSATAAMLDKYGNQLLELRRCRIGDGAGHGRHVRRPDRRRQRASGGRDGRDAARRWRERRRQGGEHE